MAGDFVGVVFESQSIRRHQIRHAAILEVKHLKKGGTASVPSAADATGIPRPKSVRESDALSGVRVPPALSLTTALRKRREDLFPRLAGALPETRGF